MARFHAILTLCLLAATLAAAADDDTNQRLEMLIRRNEERIQRLEQRLAELEAAQPTGRQANGTIGRMPESCPDLWRIGHSMAGFYPVKSGDRLEMVYCDQEEFAAVSVGQIDVKPQQVHFYVKRSDEFKNGNNAVLINYPTRVRPHPAMEGATFRAPVSGTYFFHFWCRTYTYSLGVDSLAEKTQVTLLVNSEAVAHNHHDSYESTDYTMAITATVDLLVGDRVETRFDYGILKDMNFGGSLIDAPVPF